MSEIPQRAEDSTNDKKLRSIENTRKKLEEALSRILSGKPRVVSVNAKITAANVAKEDGVDRATLYRFHDPVLEQIRLQVKPTETLSSDHKSKEKEYRALVIEAQSQVEALARINYQLQAKVDELQNLLMSRDNIIKELKSNAKYENQNLGTNSIRKLF